MSSSQPIALSDDEDSDLPELTFKSTGKSKGRSQTATAASTVVQSDDDEDGNDSSSSGYAVVATTTASRAAGPASSNKRGNVPVNGKASKKAQNDAPLPARPLPSPPLTFAPTASTKTSKASSSKQASPTIVEDESDATTDSGPLPVQPSNGKKLRKSGSTRVEKPAALSDGDAIMDEADVPPVPAHWSSASKRKTKFQDRLSHNLASSPRFSKAFKGKVKGSNSTSMVSRPLSVLVAETERSDSP